jgi:ABC-type Zn uptake system ZnuABC Zn-binding protein ZnuA
MSRRRFAFWIGVALIPMAGCTTARDPFEGAKPGQVKILVSFPPLYCFAANVAGEHAKVLCLLSAQGPHDYSGSPLDRVKVAHAQLFVVNGLGLDDFVSKPVADAHKKSIVFEVGEALPDDKLIHLKEGEHHVHEDGTECTHGDHDPHIWLGPAHAELMVGKIAERLGQIEPAHKAAFDANAAAYAKELQKLRAYGLEKLTTRKNRKVLVTHDFLRYFAQEYQLEVVGAIRPRTDLEADAGQMAKLAKQCKEQDVQVIIVEPQYSKVTAESLQQHLKSQGVVVRLVEFDPMETANVAADGNPDPGLYLSRMRTNIDNLAKALP